MIPEVNKNYQTKSTFRDEMVHHINPEVIGENINIFSFVSIGVEWHQKAAEN